MRSISWFPEEWPCSVDDIRHGGFAKQPPLLGPSPEISLKRGRSDLEDDDDSPTQTSQLLLHFPGRKRKFVECDSDLEVARDVPSSKRICLELHTTHTTIATTERPPEAHFLHTTSEERVDLITNSDLTSSGCVPAPCSTPDFPVLSYPAIPLSPMSRYQSSGDGPLETQSPSWSLQCHEFELPFPESLTTSLAVSSHVPLPNHSASDSRPQSAGSGVPFNPYVDNDVADLSSDSGLTSDDSSCGSWAYLETDSPTGAFVTPQDGLCQAPNFDASNPSFIFDLSTDVEIDLTRHYHLERPRLSPEGSEGIFDNYKRKRLFISNEDEYEERPCKRRSIEQ